MKKIFVILTVIGLVLAGCAAPGAETKADQDILRVGMELKYPPFETKDSNGEPAGASVMLAKALGDHLGKEIEIVDTPYPSLIPALESGSIDMIISSMTITEKRQEVVDFSDPYTTSQLMMLVHKDSPVNSPEDLNAPDVIIASKTGTIGALWAKTNASDAQIKSIDEEASAVLEVAQGKADVFIYDPLSVIRHHENYPDTTRTVLEPLPNTKGWGVAVPKGADELREAINAFLKEAKTDGTYDEIRETYLQDKIEEFEEYGLDFFF